MSALAAFPEFFTELCRKATDSSQNQRRAGYYATANQVLFFTAAASRNPRSAPKKASAPTPAASDWHAVPPTTVATIAPAVAAQLAGLSGEVVTGLKAGLQEKDAVTWSAFLRQLRPMQQRLARQFDYQLDPSRQDDAISKSLSKLFTLIQTMPDGVTIDGAPDLYAFTDHYLQSVGALYNFRKPFWAYVFRVLYNEFLHALRRSKTDFNRFCTLEEALDLDSSPHERFVEDEESDAALQQQVDQLRLLLPRLFAAIEALPRKRRLVAAYTLAGRAQFWVALQLAEVSAPPWYPAAETFTTDQQIAQQLAMTDNSVRAHRSYGYQDMVKAAPALGQLFLVLIDVHF